MKTITGLHALQKLSFGNAKIKIAILDGPVDLAHPCFNTLDGKLSPWPPRQQILPSSPPNLALNHGTAVASLIFGQPGSGVEGVAPGCSGIIIPIYSEDNKGNFSSASQVELAKSIIIAMEQGANIINISGGQFSKTGDAEVFLKDAIDKCHKAGVLIVAAAGNEGCRCLHVPAADRQVLAVGSIDENGEPTSRTNFGDAYKMNGILAQGKNLLAASPGGGSFLTGEGTSYATPIVSGIVGLLMSLQIHEGIEPDAYIIKSILEQTAIPCIGNGKTDCRRFLRGKLNLPAAIAAIMENPGVLASGLDFTTPNRIIMAMPEPQAPIHDEMAFSEVKAAVVPANEAPGPKLAEGSTEVPKMLEIDTIKPNEQIMEPPSVNTIDSHLEVQPADDVAEPIIDNPPLKPSDMETTVNGESSPIINNSKNSKMENMINEQNIPTEVADPTNAGPQVLTPSGEIDPSDCGCGGGKASAPALVYALGTIGYDFGSESHRDSFVQSMGGGDPHNPAALLDYLSKNPWGAEELIWTLNIDQTPIYSLIPNGPYSTAGYERLRHFLQDQQNGAIQRISVPGLTKGSATLLNGQSVSNLFFRVRGMYAWTTEALVGAATTGAKGTSKVLAENVANFLNRIYYQMRNLGITAEERALNYAATNAFQVSTVFASALKENLELNDIFATKSPICRPGSDCYDVVLSFFNPKERLTQARKEFRFTIDVSDVVPVTVGEIRTWSVY
ncbi:MAG: PatA/PatG family cyanobactin maturation protease [Bacteroidetes bacterium]|nr:PatA/PatG family cyanobactin maturation protease [Bacteroidota bacterium]